MSSRAWKLAPKTLALWRAHDANYLARMDRPSVRIADLVGNAKIVILSVNACEQSELAFVMGRITKNLQGGSGLIKDTFDDESGYHWDRTVDVGATGGDCPLKYGLMEIVNLVEVEFGTLIRNFLTPVFHASPFEGGLDWKAA